MPYNLRKRQKAPEPAPVAVKKRKPSQKVQKDPEVQEQEKQQEKREHEEPQLTNDALSPEAQEKPAKGKRAPRTKKAEKAPETKEVPKSKKVKLGQSKQPTETKEAEVIKEADVEPEVKSEAKSEEVNSVPVTEGVHERQYCFGVDSCGELGAGKIGFAKKLPTLVNIGEDITMVACGPMHTISLGKSGKVYSYGCNDEGALGRVTDGDEDLESKPAIVAIDGKVVKITSGDSHSAALTESNEAYVWGNFRDEHGSIGLTPKSDGKASFEPIMLLPDRKLTDIASGSNHMLLLDDTGKVYSFGVGAQGQLGRLSPEDVADDKPINEDNRELYLTPKEVSFKNVDPARTFICDAIYAGNFSSFATNTDKKKNRLAAWGLNNYFQLGYKGQQITGENKDKAYPLVQHIPKRSTFTCSTCMVAVACGQHHTLFLTKTGRVYVAGRNEYGMLGIESKDKGEVCPAKQIESLGNSVVNISAGINTSFVVTDEGKLFSWGMGGINLGCQGDGDLTKPTEVVNLSSKEVLSVSAGGAFTAVIARD